MTLLFWLLPFLVSAHGPNTLAIWQHHQSTTWVAHRGEMLHSPDAWAAYWPAVRYEARPQLWSRWATPICADSCALQMPDTLAQGWHWYVTATDSAGNTRRGPEVAR